MSEEVEAVAAVAVMGHGVEKVEERLIALPIEHGVEMVAMVEPMAVMAEVGVVEVIWIHRTRVSEVGTVGMVDMEETVAFLQA